MPTATITLTGLTDYLFKPGRKARLEPRRELRPVLGPDGRPTGAVEPGEELPREEQFVFGQCLLNLLLTTQQPDSISRLRLLGKLVDRLEECLDTGADYEANEVALSLLRDAVRHNGMNYRPYLLAQLLDHIGTGAPPAEDL